MRLLLLLSLVASVWMAWIFSILIVTQCNFMTTTFVPKDIFTHYPDTDDNNNSNNNNNNDDDSDTSSLARTTKSFGLLSRPFVDDDGQLLGCVRYTTTTTTTTNDAYDATTRRRHADTQFHVGTTFGIITIVLLTISAMGMSNVIVLGQWQSNFIWRVAHWTTICAAISQMLVFVALGSDRCYHSDVHDGCHLSGSGILAIFNTILLDGICLAWYFIPPPRTPCLQQLGRHCHSSSLDTVPMADPPTATSVYPGTDWGPTIGTSTWNIETIDEVESTLSECSVDDRGDENKTEPNDKHSAQHVQDSMPFRLTTVLLIAISWMVSILGVQRCTFVLVGYQDEFQTNYSGIGLFSLAIQERDDNGNSVFLGCVAYPDHAIDTLDSPFRAARAFGAITTLITSGILVLAFLQLIVRQHIQKVWFALRVAVPISIITLLFSFTVFGSDVCSLEEQVECRLGGTGKMVICNIILLLVLSALVYCTPPPSVPLFEKNINS
jgi:hypothetical protein